jgi:hypothetical protein
MNAKAANHSSYHSDLNKAECFFVVNSMSEPDQDFNDKPLTNGSFADC